MNIENILNLPNHECLEAIVDYYYEAAKQDDAVTAFLNRKGLNHAELVDHFKLGVANRQLGLLLPDKQLKAGKLIRSKLQDLGVLRTSGHEHLNGSLVVPILDIDGRLIDLFGQKLNLSLRKGTPLELNLNPDVMGIWNLSAINSHDELIVCANIIDAMTFWRHGYLNVVGLYLRSQLTLAEINLFKEQGVKRLLIAPELSTCSDELQQQGFDCYCIKLPIGISVNQYANSVPNSIEALGGLIRHSDWVETSVSDDLDIILDDNNLDDSEDDFEDYLPFIDDAEGDALSDEPLTKEVSLEKPLPSLRVPDSLLDIPVLIEGQDVFIELGDRSYRIRGLFNNTAMDKMKINLLVRLGDKFHVDQFDLYISRQRATYIHQASLEISVHEETIKQDLGKLLLKLEAVLDDRVREQQLSEGDATKPKEMSPQERQEALSLLQSPKLMDQLLLDYKSAGVIGEETNKQVAYLAAVSRLLESPLAIIIQSTSAAGKSTLMESILSFIPPEEKVTFSAMTGQSLYYMGQQNIKHKILAIAEEEGIGQAAYALKLLQSEGQISIASTGKNAKGQLVTETYKVEGPVMLFLTTTAIDIDEELLNRCLVLTVNESREQTEAIHSIQRQSQTLQGLLQKQDKQRLIQVYHNVQRLLKPLLVANPYAEYLGFLSTKTRTRRDHMKYLTLIRSVCLLHQYQREVKTMNHNETEIHYIEVTPQDIQIANQLAHAVLGSSLDELPPQTRNLLYLIEGYAQQECTQQNIAKNAFRFTRKALRNCTGWGQTQLRIHLDRLVEMEYLLVHRGGRGQTFEYELLWDQNTSNQHQTCMGLIEPDTLFNEDDSTQSNPTYQ